MDPDKLKAFAKLVFGALGGAHTAAMIHLGDRLGLYRALADREDASSEELAEATGLHERWVREWLYQQGAAGVLEHRGGDRFALGEEGAAVLADETSPAFGAGFFSHLPQTIALVEKLPEVFRTGMGLPYDALGAEGARGIERGFAPWFRTMLVPVALPQVPGAVDALERGVEVADVGCGAGLALIEMARAFPRSRFHGFELSRHAIDRATANREAAGVTNVEFHDGSSTDLPDDGRFTLVTSFDCLHDMTDPAEVMRKIRMAIRPDGIWLISEMKGRGSYEANVERNPVADLMYGTSIVTCLSSSLSEPGGAGLGTLGLHAELLERMVEEAGFTRFETLPLKHPMNAFYVARP